MNGKAIVLTGGPGMGKTTIINYLSGLGHDVMPEAGRQIIQHQVKTKGNRLPWADQQGYAMEMFQKAVSDYDWILNTDRTTFFDRGIPDVIGYLMLCRLPVSSEIWQAARSRRYHKKVFITPPWKEIYLCDTERKQTYEQAVATYDMMRSVYEKLGYILVTVPTATVENRAAFIANALRKV
ncbi:AAA family ATPase [Arachidicoccus terrestris]|uniref:AAA family ATPase n=1 Tax=Arachidicoccus terrestris TaxID=2875539 RepID=UPI001CC6A3F5|nr:AAA family ATPase [Arachidicoccus terrestris]UAY54088.1 AAA family ATPase [Arachidicoccus terrestris]